MSEVILYGAGLVAKELYRYILRCQRETMVVCFAVTDAKGQPTQWEGVPVLEIREALQQYPQAAVRLALQEKFHAEVQNLLASMGVIAEDVIGVRKMTTLLKEEGIRDINQRLSNVTAAEDTFDYSMMTIGHHDIPEDHIYKLLPLTQIPLQEDEYDFLADLDRWEPHLFDKMGHYRVPGDFEKGTKTDCSVFVGMACSGKDTLLRGGDAPAEYIHPVFAGSALQDNDTPVGFYRDDEGVNVSLDNRDYAELSVTYWLWKNATADYLGLCHYRRHFVLDEHALELLRSNAVDVVITRPRLTFPSVKEYFVDLPITNLREDDYQLMMEILRKTDKECSLYAEKVFGGRIHYPNNMVIARKDIFASYCHWLFGILEEMKSVYKKRTEIRNDRYLAYAGEMLTTLYFMFHHNSWKRIYVDYSLLS